MAQNVQNHTPAAPHIYLCTCPELPGKEGWQAEHEAGLFLLAAGLRELTGISLTASQLSERIFLTEKKKPALSAPDLSFNISHSHGLAVCAFASESVGVDVEKVREVGESLLRRVLTPAEQEICSRSQTDQNEIFMRLWTLKEAYGKQCGVGIGYPMNEISFSLPDDFPPAGQCITVRSPLPGLSFFQWQLTGGYFLSLCCGAHYAPEQITLHFLS